MKIYMVSLLHRATINNILFIDVSASHQKPSSGLTSGADRQYVKSCPICGSTGSSPELENDKRFKDRTNLEIDDIMELLEFVVTTTYFTFRGVTYQQRFAQQ